MIIGAIIIFILFFVPVPDVFEDIFRVLFGSVIILATLTIAIFLFMLITSGF